MGYTSGEPSIVTAPGNSFPYSTALRYFPRGRRNCYNVPVQTGRYFVRLFFNYGNYDLKNQVREGHKVGSSKLVEPSVLALTGTSIPAACTALRPAAASQLLVGRTLPPVGRSNPQAGRLSLPALQVPRFWVSVESTTVVAVQPSTPGGFQDMLVPVDDGEATICLMRPPSVPYPTLINSIEILQVGQY